MRAPRGKSEDTGELGDEPLHQSEGLTANRWLGVTTKTYKIREQVRWPRAEAPTTPRCHTTNGKCAKQTPESILEPTELHKPSERLSIASNTETHLFTMMNLARFKKAQQLFYLVIPLLLIVAVIGPGQAYQLTNNLIANNLPPKFITQNSQSANSEIVVRVKEGPQSIGKLIYTLKGEDPDDDSLTFGVLGSTAIDLLRIENVPGNQANVYLRKELDRETTDSHQVVITLTDGKLGRGNWVSLSPFYIRASLSLSSRLIKQQRLTPKHLRLTVSLSLRQLHLTPASIRFDCV